MDDIVAVVSRSLVRTQRHISSGLLELHARTYYTVYYAYGSRIDYHYRSSLGYERCLVSVAVGQVNSDEGAVQISQIVQKCRRSLAVSPVSYTHLDVYKRQILSMEEAICELGVVFKQRMFPRRAEASLIAAVRKYRRASAVSRRASCGVAVSYTHLDVYKRQSVSCSTLFKEK